MAGLNEKDDRPAVVRGAMAHLNLVQIHPFADGNGRIGRALHTLVMVRDGILDPEFAGIEKSIARDRTRYRESLAVGPAWPGIREPTPDRSCVSASARTCSRRSARWPTRAE